MKVLVTGGTGFIGSNLVNKLVELDYQVEVIDNNLIDAGKINKKANYHEYDLSDVNNLNQVSRILNSVDSVFHLAAKARVQPSIDDPIGYELNNTLSTVNILKACVDSDVRRFVYSSSSSVYGDNDNMPLKENFKPNPLSPYGAQKYYGEILCNTFAEVYDIETVSLRYFNVYGEGQNIGGAYSLVIGIFFDQMFNGKPLTIRGDGNQKRDFTYVGDVVNANILASKSHMVGSGEVLNIGNGNNRTINQIADLFDVKKEYIEPVLEPKETLADIKLAKDLLNWEPTTSVDSWIKQQIIDYEKK